MGQVFVVSLMDIADPVQKIRVLFSAKHLDCLTVKWNERKKVVPWRVI